MPELTPNLKLKKPTLNENADVGVLNENMDSIDQAIQAIKNEKGQPNGLATLGPDGKVPSTQLPTIEVPVTSVNQKTGDVVLTASDVGAETPTGAQTKANLAEQNAKIASLPITGGTITGDTTVKGILSGVLRNSHGYFEIYSYNTDNYGIGYLQAFYDANNKNLRVTSRDENDTLGDIDIYLNYKKVWHEGNQPKITVSATAPTSPTPKENDIWIEV